ncbi:MAG TPA: glycoside hydrolase family 27 protein [Chitinophagaceae bacterium]|nr:glycoside hydrolase family 27 protein [Chitinophagaceae bacterium]
MRTFFTLILLLIFTLGMGQDKDGSVATVPPMGWNSYDCYGATVTGGEVKANARYVAKHLKSCGWDYIVVDFCWFYPNAPDSKVSPPQQTRLADGSYTPKLAMDRYGRLLPVIRKFPAAAGGKGFGPLAEEVHSLGLQFGIHIMRGIPRQAVRARTPVLGMPGVDASMICDTASTCSWLNAMYGLDMKKPGAQAYLNSLLRLYASWGVDFIKVDDISRPYHAAEIEGYRKAIAQCGRPIVLSLSPGATPLSEANHVMREANMWRLADDFWDSWKALKPMFHLAAEWAPYAGPGHWPNLDMIPVGKISKRGPVGPERYSRFSPAEKRTMMTLWCIARSPLILGGNLPENTPADLAWETNKEVLAVDQKGRNARELYRKGDIVVWVSKMPDPGVWNIAIFNLGDGPEKGVVPFSLLGIPGAVSVRDLWKHQQLGKFSRVFTQRIQPHDAALFRIKVL